MTNGKVRVVSPEELTGLEQTTEPKPGPFKRLASIAAFVWSSKTATVGLSIVLFWVFVAVFARI